LLKLHWGPRHYRENLIALLLIAILIGMTTGFLAVGFRYLLLWASSVCWRDPFNIIGSASGFPWYLVVALPILGGLLIGPAVAFWAPETRGAGVPEVIEAVVAREGCIRHRTTLSKLATTVISIGSGASVGREGPIVHMGASVGSSIAQMIRLSPEWRRVFLACGAAAGIAATFNAPMAGMLFAAEIILVDFQVSYLSHLAISAVTATVVSHHFLGSLPAFDIPYFELVSYWEMPLYGLLGILAGLLGIAFIKTVGLVEDTFTACKVPIWLRPACGGLLVGLLAVLYPHVLGVGYETINLVLAAKAATGLMMVLIVCKLAATAFSLGAGFSGGIFAPSLVLGGLLGGVFGVGVHTLWPDLTAAFPAYALIGMGALVAGTTLAPITAIFTIFELTYNFDIILPVMTGAITSLITVQTLYGHSIYETKLIRKGIRMLRGHDVNLLRSMQVKDYMDRNFEWVREDTRLGELIRKAQNSAYPHFPVLNHADELIGILSLRDLKVVLAEMGDLCELVVASEIMCKEVYTLSLGDNFETAFKVFEGRAFSTLPVIDQQRPGRVVGLLKKSTLMLAYNQKVLKLDTFSKLPSQGLN
ncbi:MAG: chloride channel protein, partial [Desulfuromonadaceae bacterium]